MAALLAVAAARQVTPRRQALAIAGLCLAGTVLDLVFLVSGAETASLKLPLGLPGFGATLSLDPLSGLFLLPMLTGAGACCLGRVEPAGRRGRGAGAVATVGLPCCLAALLLTCLAGDGFTLVLAAATVPAAAALCSHGPARGPGGVQEGHRPGSPGAAPSRDDANPRGTEPGGTGAMHGTGAVEGAARGMARLLLGVVLDPVAGSVLAGLCLAVAVALLVPSGGLLAGPMFAAIRAHPPEGWRATAVLGCSLLGTARLCGLCPHPGRNESAAGLAAGADAQGVSEVTPGAAAALATAVPLAGLYVLARLLLDLCGAATPLWWGVPVLAAGSAAVAAGGLRAATAARLEGIVEGVVAGAGGIAVAGLGVALVARGADLPLLAALALGGTGLLVLAQGPLVALLVLLMAAVGRAAGSTTLARLGGLLGRMPVAGACLLVAAASVARLPVSAGFPGGWMVAEALLQAPRLDGPWLGVALAVALVAGACGTALFAAAALRLVGTALLGRPRSPRGAAAGDVVAPERQVLVALAAVLGAIGVAPPLALALAGPAVAQLSLVVPEGAASAAWTVSPLRDGAGYAALPLAGLVAVAAGALAWAMWRRMARGTVERRGWEGGFAAPPPWLPFGDPATQLGPRAIDAPLLRLAAGLWLSSEQAGDPGRGATDMGIAADDATGAGLAAGLTTGPSTRQGRRGPVVRDVALAALHGAGRCEAWMGRLPLPWLVGTVATLLCLLVWAAAA